MLSSASNLRLVGEASSGAEALGVIDALKPELILMDVHMPELDGPATAKAVLTRHPEIKVVAWTVSESSDDLLRMMAVGCSGYVLKDAGPGESPVPRKMSPDVLRRVAESTPVSKSNLAPLTSREMQILRGIAKGHTTKRMAADLGLAAPSIETVYYTHLTLPTNREI